jgi:hypothetical protein
MTAPAPLAPPSATSPDWWRGAVIYQIYPRSFCDANGDGIGDLPGATRQLEHVARLGVDGVWLSPFFTSPMRDFGYDVSDQCSVDPMFGTLADFDAFVARAHALGLKVLIDQVWSHTAAEHPWFAESRTSRDNPKADWYVWADARPDGSPPNNWQSWMGGPTWSWEPRRRQYGLHNFLPQMPDLNLHHPEVQDAVLAIGRFWLERGVDGFRLDTANYYCHDLQLRDNPPQPPGRRGDIPAAMQQHLFNVCQPQTLPFLERVRALCEQFADRMTVAEIGSQNNLERMVEYTRGNDRLHTAYSFLLLGARPRADELAAMMQAWQQGDGVGAWPSWALSHRARPHAGRKATRPARSSSSCCWPACAARCSCTRARNSAWRRASWPSKTCKTRLARRTGRATKAATVAARRCPGGPTPPRPASAAAVPGCRPIRRTGHWPWTARRPTPIRRCSSPAACSRCAAGTRPCGWAASTRCMPTSTCWCAGAPMATTWCSSPSISARNRWSTRPRRRSPRPTSPCS